MAFDEQHTIIDKEIIKSEILNTYLLRCISFNYIIQTDNFCDFFMLKKVNQIKNKSLKTSFFLNSVKKQVFADSRLPGHFRLMKKVIDPLIVEFYPNNNSENKF
jgi:hypothetical protein